MAEPKAPPKQSKPKPAKPGGRKQPPPEADKAPRKQQSGAAKARARKTKDVEAIREGFTKMLTMPALPAALAGDEWAADHFASQGPQLAEQLAAECERSDQLRSAALKLIQGQSVLVLGSAIFSYAVPPLMHYGVIPNVLGVPVRERPPGAARARPAEPAQAPSQPPAGDQGAAPYVRHPGGRVTRRDGSPLSQEDEARLAAAEAEALAEAEPTRAPAPDFGAAFGDGPPIEFG